MRSIVIHEEDGFLLWAEKNMDQHYIHCDIEKNAKEHWKNRQKYLDMLPKKSIVLQAVDDKRLENFLLRINAKRMITRFRNGELTNFWRLK